MRGEVAVKAAPGVIDCLSEGFGLVNRHLWVIAFPIALDVLLWVSPRISALPLVDQFLAVYRQALAEYGDPAALAGSADLQTVEEFGRLFGGTNLLTLLSWNPAGAHVPSFLAGQAAGSGPVIAVSTLGPFLALVLGLQLVGVLLGCVYLGLLGQLVRGGTSSISQLAGRVGRYWVTFLAYIGLFVGIMLAISLVIALLALVSISVAVFLSAALTTAAFFLGLLLLLYLFYLVPAVVVGERGIIGALRSSFRVVQENFWSTIGLALLTLLISQGMLVIWSRLAEEAWGMPLAIAGNAYVATGVIVAAMLFYRNRADRTVAVPANRSG